MKLWILGEIINKANQEAWTDWDFYGVYLIREEALQAFMKIKSTQYNAFFIVPIDVGELFYADVVNIPRFEYIKGIEYA